MGITMIVTGRLGKPERPSFFIPKGALTHHPKGRWYLPLASRALCEADAAAAAASRQCHSTCGRCCHRLRRRQIPCDRRRELGVEILYPCCRLPTQTCHRQLCRRDGRAFCPSIFSFTKEKQKKENEVNERWQFIIWRQRWSAGAQGAPPWPPLLT